MSRRLVPVALLVVAAAAVAFLLTRGGDPRYSARVVLADAGGLRKGSNVRLAGAPSGRVTKLELDDRDRAVAEIRLEPGAAPLGRDAKALVQADGFFGERYLELTPGDVQDPAPDGATIPESRSAVSTRVDDVVDTLDVDTRSALQAFLREQGTALVGRGEDLGKVLAALPPGLARTGELLDQFGRDNEALGRLVESSDRDLAAVARERGQLGRMLTAAGDTLDALASRRAGLRETVQRAPATLQSARATLVSLQRAAAPLTPASRGLRKAAPSLTTALRELPTFADDAVPALASVARVAPRLQQLADGGTPVVRRLAPFATTLTAYTRQALGPFTDLLDKAAPDTIGVLEGWARSTQGRDAASQIFRFGATAGSDVFGALLKTPAKGGRRAARKPRAGRTARPAAGSTPAQGRAPEGDARTPALPALPAVPDLAGTAGKVLSGVLGGAGVGPKQTPPSSSSENLLDFLLAP